MRIVHVTQPVEAGVAVVVTALAAHQADNGHHVTVICPPEGSASGPLATIATHPFIEFLDWAAKRSPGPSVVDEARRLRQLIRGSGADVVMLHSAKAGLAGRLAIRGQLPTVYVPHSWSFEAVVGVTHRLALAWEQTAERWTNFTVCVSRDERRRGHSFGLAAEAIVIANGVDIEHFVPGPKAAARAQLGLPDVPTAVCVGRLTHQKGQDRLLAAWPAVRRSCPDAQLVFVGDGPDRAALESLAVDGVRFMGATSDTRPYLGAADLVAVASRWEAGSLVPLEAMASGRAVVAVDATGIREVLGDAGVIVDGGDGADAVAALAQALVGRLLDPSGTAELGRRSRARAVDNLALASTLAYWDELLVNAVAAP